MMNRIETLEYELGVVNDALKATQRNYDNVSRLLRQEKEKEHGSKKEDFNLKSIIHDLEEALRVSENRVKDLLSRVDTLERTKVSLNEELDSKGRKMLLEMSGLYSSITDLKNKLTMKTNEYETVLLRLKETERRFEDLRQQHEKTAKQLESDKRVETLTIENARLKVDKAKAEEHSSDCMKRLESKEKESKERQQLIEKLKFDFNKLSSELVSLKDGGIRNQDDLVRQREAIRELTEKLLKSEVVSKEALETNKKLNEKIKVLELDKDELLRERKEVEEFEKLGRKLKDRMSVEDCVTIGVKELDKMRERDQRLMKEIKQMEDVLRKKDAKIFELSKDLDEKSTTALHLNNKNELIIKDQQIELEKLRKRVNEAETTLQDKQVLLESANRDIKHLKARVEKLNEETTKKSKEAEDKGKSALGLGSEINNLKDQLHQKIQTLNSLSSKNSILQDADQKLRNETDRANSLAMQVRQLRDGIERLESENLSLNAKLKSQDAELTSIKQSDGSKRSVLEYELVDCKSTIVKLSLEVKTISQERNTLSAESSKKTEQMMEMASRLKGMNMRLESYEAMMSKYDLEGIEKKIEDVHSKGETIYRAASKIKSAMDSLKITVICRKCGDLPKEGKTLFPCGHCYCSGCEDKASTSCMECHKTVESRARNPLIDEVMHRYNYMTDVIASVLDSCAALERVSIAKANNTK